MCNNDEPYIVTLSYGYDSESNSLFFHCSNKGLKLDFIKNNPKVCGTIIEDLGYVINECGHNYNSVVFWGNMKIITDLEEKKHGMKVLLNHLEEKTDVIESKLLKSNDYYSKMEVLKLPIMIRPVTGKLNLDLSNLKLFSPTLPCLFDQSRP